MDINNVNFFDAMYITGQARMRVCLVGSERFGVLKDTRAFTDQEKSDYIDELLERRFSGNVATDNGSSDSGTEEGAG